MNEDKVLRKLDDIMAQLENIMVEIDSLKTDGRTKNDRRLAILNTELEKCLAFALYIEVNYE